MLNLPSNLYSKFNTQMNSNKGYLSAVYGNSNKVQYYNGKEAEKTKKKNTVKVVAILASALFAVGSIVTFALTRNKVNPAEFVNKTMEHMPLYREKVSSLMTNFTNIKDDLWDRFITKFQNGPFGFLKKGADSLTNVYKKNVYKAVNREYSASIAKIKSLEGGCDINFKEFNPLFKDIDNSINTAIKSQRISSNLLEGRTVGDKIKNLIAKTTEANIANTRISGTKILDCPDVILPIKESYSEELKNAIEKHNKLFTHTLIPKLRDINCGSAPTDVITVLTPILGLGVGIANAENKEERKSILFDIGFPLIGAVIMPVVGTFVPVINGCKAIIAGFATGQILSMTAKGITKLAEKKSSSQDDKIKKDA